MGCTTPAYIQIHEKRWNSNLLISSIRSDFWPPQVSMTVCYHFPFKNRKKNNLFCRNFKLILDILFKQLKKDQKTTFCFVFDNPSLYPLQFMIYNLILPSLMQPLSFLNYSSFLSQKPCQNWKQWTKIIFKMRGKWWKHK